MVPDAHEVVQAAVDGLRATCSISWQRPVAMGWSSLLRMMVIGISPSVLRCVSRTTRPRNPPT